MLRGEYVNGAGADGRIAELTPSLMDLDISRSLMHNWSQVASITKQLVHLIQLNVR